MAPLHCEHADALRRLSADRVPQAEQHAHKQRQSCARRSPAIPALHVPATADIVRRAAESPRTACAPSSSSRADGASGCTRAAATTSSTFRAAACSRPRSRSVVAAHPRTRARRQARRLSGIDVREVEHAGARACCSRCSAAAARMRSSKRLAREFAPLDGVAASRSARMTRASPAFLGAPPEHVAGAREAAIALPGGAYHLATYGRFVQAHRGQAAAIATRMIEARALRARRAAARRACARVVRRIGRARARAGAARCADRCWSSASRPRSRSPSAPRKRSSWRIETRSARRRGTPRASWHAPASTSTPRSSTRRGAALPPEVRDALARARAGRDRLCLVRPRHARARPRSSRVSGLRRARDRTVRHDAAQRRRGVLRLARRPRRPHAPRPVRGRRR